MTAPLERHYRRLLALYPAGHRRDYEEEMVGVLMAGAGSGQRRPAPGEAMDLLRSGLTARLGRGAAALRTTAWRGAAAVAALAGVVILALAPARRLLLALRYVQESGDPMHAFGIDGGLLSDVAARSVAWLAVLIAVLLAARRTAVVLGTAALLVEIAVLVTWGQQFRIIEMSWVPALAVLTLVLLVLSYGTRPAAALPGRPSTAVGRPGTAVGRPSTAVGRPSAPVGRPDAPVGRPDTAAGRRRALVLLAPVVAVPMAQPVLEQAVALPLASSLTPGLVLTAVVVMAGVPLAAFAAALLTLRRSERAGRPATAAFSTGEAG